MVSILQRTQRSPGGSCLRTNPVPKLPLGLPLSVDYLHPSKGNTASGDQGCGGAQIRREHADCATIVAFGSTRTSVSGMVGMSLHRRTAPLSAVRLRIAKAVRTPSKQVSTKRKAPSVDVQTATSYCSMLRLDEAQAV